MVYTKYYMSPLGGIILAADDEGLIGLWFDGQKYFGTNLPKEYEEKEKTKPNIDNNKIIKEKEEQKKKQLSEIEMKKQQVRNKLMESLNETNDDYELNLPENFFDNNRDKEANNNKEENTKKKVMTKPIPVKEEKKEDNDISSDSESITSEYEGEVDSMINCATKVNNIILHYNVNAYI